MPVRIRPTILAFASLAVLLAPVSAQEISQHLVANNLWYATRSDAVGTPSGEVMSLAQQAGIRLIRIGGAEFDRNMPSNAALLTWVDRIRATGAEPLIQVSQYGALTDGSAAASAVHYLNVVHGRKVRYWSIGNEPWLQAGYATSEADIAARIEAYFKARASAMKEVDPAIKIFGVDSEDFQTGLHNRLFGGANNIAGLVPGKSYYYCDGISWHRYPQSDASVLRPELDGLNNIRTRIQNAASLIAAVNASQGRVGEDALLWGIGEFNAKNGTAVHTFGNGQMFAGVYALSMKYGARFAAAWSLRESTLNNRGPQDYSLLDGGALIPRSSYWHTQLVSRYFTGRYLEGSPSISHASSDLLVFGAADDALERVSVMIMNRGASVQPYTLHLNQIASFAAPDATAVRVDADRPEFHSDVLDPHSTHVLVFTRKALIRITYAKSDFDAAPPLPPQHWLSPTEVGLIDDFAAYPELASQGYWSPLHLNGGAGSIQDDALVLRTSNAAYSTAALSSPVSPDFNFFIRGFTLELSGFSLTSTAVAPSDTHFRIGLNSVPLRSFGSPDSLALRITPNEARLGFKVNQLNVQGETRVGTGTANAFLQVVPYKGELRRLRISLEPDPAGPVAGVSTIHYTLQLEGSFGNLYRHGSFHASAADWGESGNSALVLESRRENASGGPTGSMVETKLDAVARARGTLDDFNRYSSSTEQDYWTTLFVGSNSLAEVEVGEAVLQARADAFGSAALVSPVSPALNFRRRPVTIEMRDFALSGANLAVDQTIFRFSLAATRQRSFATPDAITLRLTPAGVRLGYKLGQPSQDAELRAGSANTSAALLDFIPGGSVSGLRLTLVPVGPPPASTIFYALRLTGSFGKHDRTGIFEIDRVWGPNPDADGDAALVLEARRASSSTGAVSSRVEARIGSLHLTPIPADLFAEAPHFTAWRLRNFSIGDLGAPAVSGPLASPSGDATANLLKYAFGLNPRTPTDLALLPKLVSEIHLHLIHKERTGASDLDYQVEASVNLTNWTVPVLEETRSEPDSDGWITVTSAAEAPESAPRVFYRVRVSTTP
jgi:hypothetical protein